MADLFDVAARHLERQTPLDSLEARGTLRIALKAGGLQARALTEVQLRAVMEQLMPRELEVRGVADVDTVCRSVFEAASREWAQEGASRATDPDEIFRRIAGD